MRVMGGEAVWLGEGVMDGVRVRRGVRVAVVGADLARLPAGHGEIAFGGDAKCWRAGEFRRL